MPFGTVLDPIYASPTSSQITGYTRCGDSGLWTAAYLATEDLLYMLHGIGIETGVNLEKVVEATRFITPYLGHAPTSKYYQAATCEDGM